MDVARVNVACASCGARDARSYRRAAYTLGGQPFDLVRCRRCGLVYVDPRPGDAALAALYADPAYYAEDYALGVESAGYFERRDELLAEYDGVVARLETELGLERADVLELGSAGGFFLEAARRRGHSVRGVELSRHAWSHSVEELGLEVHRGQLRDAPYAPSSFDLAVADNVLEHTTDPAGVLRDLHALLRPGGHLLVVVPAYVNSAWYRGLLRIRRALPRALRGTRLFALLKFGEAGGGAPYHLQELDRATLGRLLREAGFETLSIDGSVPFPAYLFEEPRPGLGGRCLRLAFRSLDVLMARRCLPAVRLRALARRP